MSRSIVSTDKGPKAIGTYSQAVSAGGMLYVSGQIPLDPATGNLVEGGMEAQIRRSFDNLKAIVEAGGEELPVEGIRIAGRHRFQHVAAP